MENRYKKFIEHYKNMQDSISVGFEKHHILPFSMGGSNNKENIVKLPIRAHYLAHVMLAKIYPEMWTAVWLMSSRNKKINSSLYEKGKIEYKKWLKTDVGKKIRKKIQKKSHSTKSIIGEDGLNSYQRSGVKISIASNVLEENGLSVAKNRNVRTAKERSKESYELASNKISKKLNSIAENGLTIAKNGGVKSAETKNKIQPNGITISQSIAKNAAKTMSLKGVDGISIYERSAEKQRITKSIIGEDGLTIAGRSSLKSKETKTKNGTTAKGEDVNTANIVEIFDNNDNLVYVCKGNFFNYCEKLLKIPYHGLRDSYENKSIFVFDHAKAALIREKMKFEGWFIKKEKLTWIIYDNKNIMAEGTRILELIKKFTTNNNVIQFLQSSYRKNEPLSLANRSKSYLQYEKIDGWKAIKIEK